MKNKRDHATVNIIIGAPFQFLKLSRPDLPIVLQFFTTLPPAASHLLSDYTFNDYTHGFTTRTELTTTSGSVAIKSNSCA